MNNLVVSILTIVAMTSFPRLASSSQNSLFGTWATHCTPLPKRHSAVSNVHFDETNGAAHFILFADNGCAITNLNIDINYQYSIGSPTDEVTPIDLLPTSVTMTLLSPEVVQYYNSNQICGLTGWELNQPKDISGASCPAFQAPTTGQMTYDIFEISDGTLRFGVFPNAGPPTEVDRPNAAQKDPAFNFQSP